MAENHGRDSVELWCELLVDLLRQSIGDRPCPEPEKIRDNADSPCPTMWNTVEKHPWPTMIMAAVTKRGTERTATQAAEANNLR